VKAVIINEYGGRDRLQLAEVPVPDIREDEVLVRIKATSVNPVDWKAREGMLREHRPFDFPLILGWDLSGVVVETGQKVNKWKAGDEVFGLTDLTRNGTYAEYIAVKAAYLAKKRGNLTHLEAASIPLVGLTAWQSLVDTVGIKPGDRVLIHAGAGGVGSFAIQLAKYLGAYVVATASERNESFLRELGADHVIDYRRYDFVHELSGLDLVFHTVGGTTLENSYRVLKPGGKIVSIAGFPDAKLVEQYAVHVEHVEVRPDGKQVMELVALLEQRHIKPVVTQVFSMEEIAEAHQVSETGHVRGKIGIEIPEETINR
jgi:NADPH:quinone reductase-like Zn-dependent oxidoreductase